MTRDALSFQFDIADALRELVRSADARPAALQLSVPFMNVLIHPIEIEKSIAAEIIVRATDRRVLNARECCDECIENALRSLQELRSLFSEKKALLARERNRPLSALIELMLVAIRQFLTFQQKLSTKHREDIARSGEKIQLGDNRQLYFDTLELLRGHLSRCLGQVSLIAGMNAPSDGLIAGYQGAWPLDAYKPFNLEKL